MLSWIASWWSQPSAKPKSKASPPADEPHFEDTSEDFSSTHTPERHEHCLQENFETPELTPELPSHLRFMVQRGQVVGVENTVRRYQEHRPIKLHCTPFEKRVDDVMQEELEAAPLQQLDLNMQPIELDTQPLEASAQQQTKTRIATEGSAAKRVA